MHLESLVIQLATSLSTTCRRKHLKESQPPNRNRPPPPPGVCRSASPRAARTSESNTAVHIAVQLISRRDELVGDLGDIHRVPRALPEHETHLQPRLLQIKRSAGRADQVGGSPARRLWGCVGSCRCCPAPGAASRSGRRRGGSRSTSASPARAPTLLSHPAGADGADIVDRAR